MTVRVRIAPSPTGNLHIGTARTALLNYLYAKHHGGTFVLRVEDTDRERSKAAYTENILAGLKGLGLDWDEGPGAEGAHGPYFQSERLEIYQRHLQALLQKGQLYACFCTPEELQAERQQAETAGQTYVYSRKCCQLGTTDVQEKQSQGMNWVYRLKVPAETLVFHDLIRGEIRFETALIGDMIVARQDLSPLYNFAVVVDDLDMQITHVLRGEDHISNTPKQILIYRALGHEPPAFGHAAMMLAPDRSKLSKRHGATSVAEYLQQGYLPEALINYLALLGWSPPEGQEILSLSELCQLFELEQVSKSGAVFDVEKLKWVNGQWIRRLTPEALWQRLLPLVRAQGANLDDHSQDWWLETVQLVQDKLTLLPDYLQQVDFLLQPQLTFQATEVEKAFAMPSAEPVLKALAVALEQVDWQAEGIHQAFEDLKHQQPFKMKEIMWPVRAALSGRTAGADLQKSILLLGRKACLERIAAALTYLSRELDHV